MSPRIETLSPATLPDLMRFFEEVAFVAPEGERWSVGVHRLITAPRPLQPGRRWFTFLR